MTVSLASGSGAPGGAVGLSVSVASSGGAQPASLQWTMNYSSSDVTSVSVSAGTSASAASKSVTCSSKAGSTICVVSGMNANILANGLLATATFQLASSIANSTQVQVTNVVASTAGGLGIAASGAGSTISVGANGWSISGTTSSAGGGATLTLGPAGSTTVTADPLGNYSFNNLANGTYTVTPAKSGYIFNPVSQNVTINSASMTAISFTAQAQCSSSNPCAQTWSISGTISPNGSGTIVALTGGTTASATANSAGYYVFNNLTNGTYALTPSKSGYTFNPSSKSVTLSGANTVADFTAKACNGNGKNCKHAVNEDLCSPGSITSWFGDRFTTQGPQKAVSFPLPTELAGVQVMVNGSPAPLMLVSDSQINFQCPLFSPGSALEITVQAENGVSTSLGQSVMQPAMPELFTFDGTNQGLVLVGSTNEIAMPQSAGAPSQPARKGEFVTLYASGLGEVVDGVSTGTPAPLDRLVPLANKVHVVVGGVEIEPAFAGLAPSTAGIFQVNAQLSPDVPSGPAVPLYVKVILADGTVFASNTVNIAIDGPAAQ